MPTYEIEYNGGIYEVEAPEGATEADFMKLFDRPQADQQGASDTIRAEAAPDDAGNIVESAAAGFTKGVPFGKDIVAVPAAIRGVVGHDLPFKEAHKAAKDYIEGRYKEGVEKYPATTIAPQAASLIGSTALLAPAKALQAPSMIGRAVKSGAAGAGIGALYGLGEGDNLKERAQKGIEQGVYGGVGGAAFSPAVDVAGAAGRAGANRIKSVSRPLTQRAMALFKSPVSQSDDVASRLRGALDVDVPQQMTDAPIPLSLGDETQDAMQQSLEAGALAGTYGDEARTTALRAREIQEEAAKRELSRLAGGNISDEILPSQAAEDVAGALQKSYKSAKARTGAAYKKVREMSEGNPLKVSHQYTKEALVPEVKELGRQFDLDAGGMENAKRLYNQALDFGKMKNVKSVNFDKLEQYRGRVSQGIANADKPAERAFLSRTLEKFDEVMDTIPEEAILAGDEDILAAFTKARAARSEQGRLFERNKVIEKILKDRELSPEQVANAVYSYGGQNVKTRTGKAAKSMIDAAGDRGEEMREMLRLGVTGRILNKSLGTEVKAGQEVAEKMVSFPKLAKELEDLIMRNTKLFKELYPDEASQQAMKNVMNAARKIRSQKPNTVNYSNTAYTLQNWLRSVSPAAERANIMGVGAGSGLEAWGQGTATLQAEQAFKPILNEALDSIMNRRFNMVERFGKRAAIGWLGSKPRGEN